MRLTAEGLREAGERPARPDFSSSSACAGLSLADRSILPHRVHRRSSLPRSAGQVADQVLIVVQAVSPIGK